MRRDSPGVRVVCEQSRVNAVGERDGRGFTWIEQTEEVGVGGNFLDSDPRCRGDLRCAGEPRARDHDFVDDDPWNDDLGVKGPQKLEVSRTTQVDERAGVGNDDHYEPARASSSCRSATG